ncbi:MAG: hypothetical protein J7L61_01370 [Thermoplasmata archaeon]|nr:hypothetical protein [Thermoplasmata archaeon]
MVERDLFLEKFLDILVERTGMLLGEGRNECPIYKEMENAYLEIRERNTAVLTEKMPWLLVRGEGPPEGGGRGRCPCGKDRREE